ncbi:MAG: hypothetical protein IT328_06560 [Caldilineaceae bacterium]|nr:hypothetical protein [Caldilineaceae bacterium]
MNKNLCLSARVMLWLMVAALSLGWLPAYAAPPVQPTTQTPIPAGCETVAPEALRDELNRVSQRIFAPENGTGNSPLDLEGMVARQWALVGMDASIDAAVNDAVAQVRADADLWQQFLSGWSPAQAEELTERVVALAFTSTTFRTAVDALAAAVAVDLADTVATLSAESATQATLCLQSYIGARYSDALVTVFTRELQAETETLALGDDASADVGIWAVIDRHKSALGGVGVIIASQIAKRVVVRLGENIAKRVAGRVVGRVVGKAGSTIIPVAGWVIGAGLIAYDLYESRDGALPQIQEGLQASEVKSAIRTEITDAVATELRLETPQLARDIANDLYATWLDFQRKYTQVLTWAEDDPAFQALLAQADDPAKLASLVDITLTALGTDGLRAALADGSMARALDLPESAYAILRASASFATMLSWADVAGAALENVVALEVYKHKGPTDLGRDDLLALLAVGEPAVTKLALVDATTLTQLLTISRDNLASLAQTLSADDLAWLGGYLAALGQEQANQLVTLLLADPMLMAQLKDERVQAQIATARDVNAVLRFLAAPVTLLGFGEDLLLLGTGRVALGLFHAKYGLWVTVLAVGLPLLIAAALVQSLLRWLLGPILALLRALGWLTRRPSRTGR